MTIINREQNIVEAIHKELKIDAQLIIRGFQELQSLDIENNDYFLASQLLSQGLERMMKVILFLSDRIQPGEMKSEFGHNLEFLWHRVRDNHNVTIKDKVINKELRVLSEFNKNARYYYLNIIDGENAKFDPQKEWETLEQDYIDSNSINYKKLTNGDDTKSLIKMINHHHIISLEKIVCILSSIIVKVNFNEVGWIVPLAFQKFSTYKAEELGTTDYAEWPQCLEHKDKPYKITWRNNLADWWERLLGRQHEKSIVVKKKNYEGIWPFRDIQKVKVIRRQDRNLIYYFIVINGYLFALNGYTADKLHLPTPYKANYAVSSLSIQPFLDIAMGL